MLYYQGGEIAEASCMSDHWNNKGGYLQCKKDTEKFFDVEKQKFKYSWIFLQRSVNRCFRDALGLAEKGEASGEGVGGEKRASFEEVFTKGVLEPGMANLSKEAL
jgi:hypothetical protein